MAENKIEPENIHNKSSTPKKGPVDLNRYQDLEGVSIRKLETGLWYLQNKALMRKVLIGILILISTVTWLITLITFGKYVFIGMNEDAAMLRELVQTQGYSHAYIMEISGQPIQFFPVEVLETSNAKGAPRYDLLAEIKNPNKRHAGTLRYSFVTPAGIIASGETFILPGDDKFITALGLELSARPQKVTLVNDHLSLSRLDNRVLPDWEKFKKEHLDITISDIKFIPPRLTGLSEKINVSQLTFTATNNSAYNYWLADMIILLRNRGQLAAVNQYPLNRFNSGETREVTISMPGIIKVDESQVIPQVDILNKKNYFDFEADQANAGHP